MKKVLFSAAACMMGGLTLLAYDFMDNGLDVHHTGIEKTVARPAAADQTYGFNYTLDETAMTAEISSAGDAVDPYEGDIVIPDEIVVDGKTYTVTSVGYMAFRDRPITSVRLGKNVKTIQNSAFNGCDKLTTVEFNGNIESLGWDCFAATKSLVSITIPGSIKEIPTSCFRNSGLREVVIEDGVETIEDAFTQCSELTSVKLPHSINSLNGTFSDCTSLATIELPEGLTNIGWTTFSNTGITELDIPEGMETLTMMSLGNMNGTYNIDHNLTKVTLPASLKKIERKVLNNRAGLKELIINGDGSSLELENTNFLYDYATDAPLTQLTLNRILTCNGINVTSTIFNRKTTLEKVIFGENMTKIPDLSACSAIREIEVLNPDIPTAGGFHADVYANAILKVPAGKSEAFKNAPVWKEFKNYHIETASCDIDVDKIRYTVGEGGNHYAVMLCFGNAGRLDNLVYGYRSDNAEADVATVLSDIAAADKRLQLTKDGDNLTGVMFDLDGNGTFDEKDVSADVMYPGAKLLASDKTTPVLSATTGIDPLSAEYLFYLPRPDELGVWVPESITRPLSDEGFILPVLVQPQGSAISNTTNWQASSSDTSYKQDRTIIVTPYQMADNSYHARPTLTGATGTTYVRYRPYINGKFVESNFMTLNVTAPEVPMTAIIAGSEAIESGLNKSVEYSFSYEPQNATYTAVSFKPADTKIATWNATSGLKTTQTAGTTNVTITYLADANVKTDFTLTSKLLNPVTAVNFGAGTEDGVINVPVRQLHGLKPVVTPADADIPEVTITLTGNGTTKADMTCSMYKVNWWDKDNVRSQFYELSGHRPTGNKPATLHVESADGAYSRDFSVNVIEADRTPLEGGYEDGTIILNEEWFGHTNGGLNYLTPDNEIIYQAYEKENPGMSFGATSQYGTIWNGKLIVVSKQAKDGGDPLPGGGRLVIADAKTLKRIGSLDDLSYGGFSGDGRGVAGATPGKIYVTSTNGIFIVDISDAENPVVTGRIGSDDNSADLYNGQTGDIITAKEHAFAVMQNNGLICINVNTDEATTIKDANIQGVTQSGDGTVWYATLAKDESGATCSEFVGLDPETLQEKERVTMPASIGTIVCGWGAWRSTAFKGCTSTDDLWFVTGAASIMGGASGDYYRYHIGDNPAGIKPFFTLSDKTGTDGFGDEVGLMTYGTPRFDERNNQLVVMAGRKGAASGGYRDHWLLLVNGDNGEIDKQLHLNPYYWFQSLPIFPDKYDAEISLDKIEASTAEGILTLDLSEYVTDKDSHDANIRLSIIDTPSNLNANAPKAYVRTTLEGNTLTVEPIDVGNQYITLAAESNGRTVTKSIPVSVSDTPVGVGSVTASTQSVTCDGRRLHIKGFAGTDFRIYDASGRHMATLGVDNDDYIFDFGQHAGIFVVCSDNGVTTKAFIK